MINGKKINSDKFEIVLKNYEISEEGNEIEFNVNENTKVKAKLIIKNKSTSLKSFNVASKREVFTHNKSDIKSENIQNKPINTSSNFQDRLKMFNQSKTSTIPPKESFSNTNLPKKINLNILSQFEKKTSNNPILKQTPIFSKQNISVKNEEEKENKENKIVEPQKEENKIIETKEEIKISEPQKEENKIITETKEEKRIPEPQKEDKKIIIETKEENKIIEPQKEENNTIIETKEEIKIIEPQKEENKIIIETKEENKKEVEIPNEEMKKKEVEIPKEEISETPEKKDENSEEESKKLANRESLDSNTTSSTSKPASKSPFLDSIPFEKYMEQNQDKRKETFCEGFFISSFPKENGKVIERSQIKYISYCKHKDCSKLPAMQPEIIFRYPLEDTKYLELNNLAATICFPSGIKVCYHQEDPLITENYMAPITNQLGERYYMMTYHFYIKMNSLNYSKNYSMHPLKHHLMKFADGYLDNDLSDKDVEKIQNELEFCQNLGFLEYVYVPFCLCIISRYPYINQMLKCLESIYKILADNNDSFLINETIMYLINSIPIPKRDAKLRFYIPYYPTHIEITSPKYKDMSLLNNNYSLLLQLFPIDNIITIFRLMIFEKKILFLDKNYDTISKVTDCFVSLLYPFQWVNPFIPIMSDQMVKYLQAFLPFINGINRDLIPLVAETLKEVESTIKDDEFFIISIDKKTIHLSSNIIEAKSSNKINYLKYLNKETPKLPTEIEKELRDELTKIKEDIDANEKNNRSSSISSHNSTMNSLSVYDLQIKNAFLHFFVQILYDYANYLVQIDDEVVFNKNLLLQNRPKKDHEFYQEFTDTQNFIQFTQNILKDDYAYFNQQISKRYERVKSIPSNFKGEHIFYIKPDFVKLDEIDFNLIDKDITERTSHNNDFIDVSKKILYNDIIIKNENYKSKDCKVYKFPESKFEKKMTLDFTPKIIHKLQDNKKKQNELEIKEEEKEKIKEEIKDFMIKFFNSDETIKNQENQKIEMCNVLKNPFGRHYFIQLLSQNHTDVKLINKDYSYLLEFFLFNALIGFLTEAETEIILEDIIKALKASKFYGEIVNKKNTITIFDKLLPKMYTYAKIVQINFWKKWFEVELFEKKNKDEIDEDFIIEVLFQIINHMFVFKLEKDFIKKVGEELIKDNFGENSENYSILRDKLLNILATKKY